MDIKEKFEEFIAQYPIFEYRLLNAADVSVHERVRTICRRNVSATEVPGPVHRQWESCRNVRKRSTAIPRRSSFQVLRKYQIL